MRYNFKKCTILKKGEDIAMGSQEDGKSRSADKLTEDKTLDQPKEPVKDQPVVAQESPDK